MGLVTAQWYDSDILNYHRAQAVHCLGVIAFFASQKTLQHMALAPEGEVRYGTSDPVLSLGARISSTEWIVSLKWDTNTTHPLEERQSGKETFSLEWEGLLKVRFSTDEEIAIRWNTQGT